MRIDIYIKNKIRNLLYKVFLKFFKVKFLINKKIDFFHNLELNIIDLGSENYSGNIDTAYSNLLRNNTCRLRCFDTIGNESLLKLKFPKLNLETIKSTVGDGNEYTFYHMYPQAASGIYPPNEEVWKRVGYPTKTIKTENVKTIKLSTSLGGDEVVDLLKMDIQGAELLVLKDLKESGILKNINLISMEMDIEKVFIGAPRFCELMDFMEKNNFEFITFTSLGLWSVNGVKRVFGGEPNFFYDSFYSRKIIWSIGLFINKNILDKNSALKTSAILHNVYNLYDYSYENLMKYNKDSQYLKKYEEVLKSAALLDG
jgi:FkbM family methyltransferase